MLSLWPSFSLLVFFLVIFLECRAIGGRVTLPLGSFLMVFCYGAIGAPLLALLFQQIPYFPDASVDPASPIAWLIGPPVEELAKALPVIVLAFLTRESRRLSIADLTLIGFASGAGFGFVEGNLNALVNGTLPSVQHIAAFGLQTQAGLVFFAGHPVSTALVGLAAGIGLRFLPPNFAYAWAPSVGVILWASFDHGIYNWKLLHAVNAGVLPEAHFVVEFLHLLTLNGQLQTWLLPIGLIAAQFFEAHLCAKAVGARRDLMLAREWRPWVINEWMVALMRAPLGRAAFAQTWGYFRLRRAFYLAAFEAHRDPKDVTLSRHARSLEDRLKRERSILFDPPRGTWLLPLPVLKDYAAQWTWRMRWVLVFSILLLFLFMLDPAGLPDWLRQFLFGEIFTASVVVAGIAFAVWRIILFARLAPPDPLAAEGAACASYYTRALLLGCALVCGMFPTLALLLGWKAFAPGAAFISGYLPGWIAQGGNLQTLLGLGTIGAAVAPDPRPAGEALRHEIAAADDRMRRLGSEIAQKIGAPDDGALAGTSPPVQLDAFLDRMATLDAERDAQARRQIALDECARQAAESTIKDPALAVQAVKDEFDRLAAELLDSAARDLDSIAALEQTYGRAWIEIMQDLDAHDTLRRRLRTPLRVAWQAQNEIDWALRVVEATDECLLPMQLTLLPELDALATTAHSERAKMVAAGIERIRAAADHYGAGDPFDFAVGTNPADEDEAALLAEFASAASAAEAPKSFGLRTPQPSEEPADSVEDEGVSEATPTTGEPNYQNALDQLIDTSERDQAYLDTIRHLEHSNETTETAIEHPEQVAQETSAVQDQAVFEARHHPAAPIVAPEESAGEVEDLIDAIKRDSGYLSFAKEPQTQDDRPLPDSAVGADDAVTPAQIATDAIVEPEDHTSGSSEAEPAADAPQAVSIVEDIAVAAVSEDVPEHDHVADAGAAGEDTTPDAEETEPAAAGHAFDSAEPLLTRDDTSALEIVETADDATDVIESDAPHVAEPAEPETTASLDPDTAHHTDLTQTVAVHADAAQDEHDAVETAPQSADETAAEPIIEELYLDDFTTSDEPAHQQDDTGVQSASLDSNDLLILDLEAPSAPQEEATRAEEIEDPQADDAGTGAQALVPVPAEEPAVAAESLRAPDEPTAKTEIRSSLFARLFQSLRRQPAESPVKPRTAEQPARDVSLSQTATAPALATPIADESKHTTLPEQKVFKLEMVSEESLSTAAPWLADLSSPVTDDDRSQQDELPLEPIEWPAAKPPVHDHAAEPVEAADHEDLDLAAVASEDSGFVSADLASPHDDVTAVSQPIENGPADDAQDELADLQDAPSVESESTAVADLQPETAPEEFAPPEDQADIATARPDVPRDAEQAPDAVLQSAPSEPVLAVADEEPAPAIDATVAAPETIETAPQQVDEFSSKADRLSHLLAKLEGAIQAKAAAEAASRKEAETAAREAEQSDAPAPSPEPQAVEVAAVEDADSATPEPEPEAQTSAPVESAAPIVEAPAVETLVDVVETPAASAFESANAPFDTTLEEQTSEVPSAAVEPPPSEDRPEETAPTQLKPDRLSYLLTKLFDSAKRQPPEPPAKAQEIEPPPSPVSTAVEEHAEEILDLRLPEADHAEPDDVQEIEFGTLRDEPAEPPAASEHRAHIEEPPTAPIAPAVEAKDLPVIDVAASEPAPEPATRPRRAEPAPLFGTARPRRPRPVAPAPVPAPQVEAKSAAEEAPVSAIELKPTLSTAERTPEASGSNTPATMPRRDWKLGAQGTRTDHPNAEDNADTAAKKSEPTLRLKTGSGALATIDAPPPGAPVAAEKTPAKYYGPKHTQGEDDENGAASPAQQRALSLADALTDFYTQAGQPQPAMHTTDRATLHRIIANGKLEAPRRRGAPWSISGMSRRGEVAIRLKPGAEQFIEFVPSTEIFGQVPHYYPRGVGKGSYVTHIPAGHLEYFDVATRQWAPVQRG